MYIYNVYMCIYMYIYNIYKYIIYINIYIHIYFDVSSKSIPKYGDTSAWIDHLIKMRK